MTDGTAVVGDSRVETPPRQRRRAPRTRTRNGLFLWLALAPMAIGAFVGVLWQQSVGTTREATVRVAFVDEVGFGDLDAERSLIVDAGAEDRVESALDVAVEIIAPEVRSFIDVVVEAESAERAVDGAEAVAAELISKSVELESADAQTRIDAAQTSLDLLDSEIADLESQMAEEAAVEASAKARLTEELTVDQREALVLEEREANDRYWALARQRNSVLDQRNGFERDRTAAESDQRAAGNLRIVEQTQLVPKEGLDPVVSAGIGGALLGLGVALFAIWSALRRSGN